jgi:hypothetical protein
VRFKVADADGPITAVRIGFDPERRRVRRHLGALQFHRLSHHNAPGDEADPYRLQMLGSHMVDLVTVEPILERVGTIRPIHFRHAEATVEEVRDHHSAEI